MALNVEFEHQSKRVRVTPGTTMFQVLEDARAQFKLSESMGLQLTHRNRPVDLSLPFRLTGISNNAALELKATGVAAETPSVRVCIQLADGKRMQAPFPNDMSLQLILTHFKLLPATASFSLSFLQREMPMDSFESTTLKELGIVTGSAIFRVQSAAVAIAPQAATVAASTLSPLPQQQTSPSKPAQTVAFAVPKPTPTASVKETRSPPVPVGDVEMKEAVEEETKDSESLMGSFEALQLLRDSAFDAVSRNAIITLLKIVTNLLSYPENEKMRAIRLSNAAFHRSVGQLKGGVEFLLSLGFVRQLGSDSIVLSDPEEAKRKLQEGLRLLYKEADDLTIGAEERPVVVVPQQADPNFDVFKPQITRMQMQPRGPSATEVLVDSLKAKQDELLKHEIPARNTTIVFPGSNAPSMSTNFDSSVADSQPSDSQILVASMNARRAEMEKANNFQTQAMRELEQLKRKKIFQSALLRVQFPDRVVLQATFHPNETVQDVMTHVADSLHASVAHHRFYLYVTPPMQKLDPSKTLADQNLVPAAHAYLSWIDALPPCEDGSLGFYLQPDLVTSNEAESKEDSKIIAYPTPLSLENRPQAASEEKHDVDAAPKSAGAKTGGKSGKKPSWLKI